jgi:hypothetical protein
MGFDITGLGSVFDFASKVIDKIFPDKTAAEAAKAKMLELQMQGEFKQLENEYNIAIQQIAVNLEEAKSEVWWKAGWRPFIGWVCGISFTYNYVFMPFIVWVTLNFYPQAPPMPTLDMGELTTLLFGMLGLGAMRTYERTKK